MTFSFSSLAAISSSSLVIVAKSKSSISKSLSFLYACSRARAILRLTLVPIHHASIISTAFRWRVKLLFRRVIFRHQVWTLWVAVSRSSCEEELTFRCKNIKTKFFEHKLYSDLHINMLLWNKQVNPWLRITKGLKQPHFYSTNELKLTFPHSHIFRLYNSTRWKKCLKWF